MTEYCVRNGDLMTQIVVLVDPGVPRPSRW